VLSLIVISPGFLPNRSVNAASNGHLGNLPSLETQTYRCAFHVAAERGTFFLSWDIDLCMITKALLSTPYLALLHDRSTCWRSLC
jgi:hypothetical protein